MRTDRELQHDVMSALEWEPSVDPTRIGVTVENGVATLRGAVRTGFEKTTAGHAASHVHGVRLVANDLIVAPEETSRKTDAQLTMAVDNALASDSAVPFKAITSVVSEGWVTLTGTVDWQYQRACAQIAAERVEGVKGVNNYIDLKVRVVAADVKSKIEAAFKRSAVVDSGRVNVDTRDGSVFLTGTVRSLAERDEAERAAWNAPGVRAVDNRLNVSLT